jgi:hypothetical protein
VKAGVKLYRENLQILEKRGLSQVSGASRAIEMYTLHHDGPTGADYGGREIAVKSVVNKTNVFKRLLSQSLTYN